MSDPLHPSTVAAFDFDNTLTTRDSLVPFLLRLKGFWKTAFFFTLLTPYFVCYLLGLYSRQEIKEQILSRFFKGCSFIELQKWGKSYADEELDSYVRREAMEKMAWHNSQGHRCIIVSASPDFYLLPWALRHGFEAALGSKLETAPDGTVTGKLEGINCWGVEKVRRLTHYLGASGYHTLYVYGDSLGDKELLALADYPFYGRFS